MDSKLQSSNMVAAYVIINIYTLLLVICVSLAADVMWLLPA